MYQTDETMPYNLSVGFTLTAWSLFKHLFHSLYLIYCHNIWENIERTNFVFRILAVYSYWPDCEPF